MHKVYLSTGSNIGDRRAYLSTALAEINKNIAPVSKASNIYETAPWGVENQRGFFNQVIYLETDLTPSDLLKTTLEIEAKMGRVREGKWEARTIDIDIIFYGDLVINEIDLVIPHPFMQDRNFVLVPFLEVAPDHFHPTLKKTVRDLYFACTDSLQVFLN